MNLIYFHLTSINCCRNRKLMLIAFIYLYSRNPLLGQKNDHFNTKEASDMIALCCSFTFQELYGNDTAIIPNGYIKFYQSKSIGMDNMYQIYIKDSTAVINFRGSTVEMVSWWENFHAAMIPASGEILGDMGTITYDFALSEGATVHSGYSLGLVFLTIDLKPKLVELENLGIRDIVITGHSQGGALANLLYALVKTDLDCDICKEFNYRVYAFAAPMVGNKVFCKEYNERFCKNGLSYNIINKADPIPRLPFKFADTLSAREIITSAKSFDWVKKNALPTKGYFFEIALSKRKQSYNKLLADFVKFQLKGVTLNQLLFMTEFSSNQASKHLDKKVILPEFILDIDYDHVGNIIKLPPFAYPNISLDSTLQPSNQEEDPKSNKKKHQNDKESWTFQHKPYNYYVNFLKEFRKQEYDALEQKYLPENL